MTLLYSSAERFLREHSPASLGCLVLDIHLGGMSGLDLQQKLVAKGSKLPIVFVTAQDDVDFRQQAQHAGCVAYLHKPVPGVFLLEAIRKALLLTSANNSTPSTHL